MLTDPSYSHLKLEAIGQMAGFKSKSSFNGTFKKLVGVTLPNTANPKPQHWSHKKIPSRITRQDYLY